MRRFRKMLVVGVLALPIPVAAVGCGGDDGSSASAQEILDQTFNNDQRVTSADLSLSVSGSIEGSNGGSFDASLDGPYQSDPDNPDAVPQLDWTGKLKYQGGGKSGDYEAGLTVTQDNAYISYGGSTYEVGSDTFGQFKDLLESAAKQQPQANTEGLSFEEGFKQACETRLQAMGASDTSACDIDFSSWLSEPQDEGTEDIEGTPTDHVSGSLNVDTALNDFAGLVAATGQTVPPAAEAQIGTVADATDITYDLYSGTDDHILRGFDFDISVDTSSIPQASAGGVDSIGGSFSLRLGGVNETQTVEAPGNAKPLSALLKQFGVTKGQLEQLGQLGTGGIGGLGGLGGGGLGGGAGAGGGGTGNTDAYFQCIQQAQTSAEIEQCSAQL